MVKLSVQISVMSGEYLEKILSLIRKYDESEVEIIVINSGDSGGVTGLCNKYKAMEIKEKCGLLMSRYLGVLHSSGDYILILDETRVPSEGLIRALLEHPSTMVAFPEIQMGNGILNHLDNIDKGISVRDRKSISGIDLIIPRFYESSILREAFLHIHEKIPDELFKQIVAKDDRIIYYEVSKITNSTVLVSKYPLLHFNETNIIKEIKKYSRYGSTSRLLVGTEYEFMLKLHNKFRTLGSLEDALVLLLHVIRGVSFLAGFYLTGNGANRYSR